MGEVDNCLMERRRNVRIRRHLLKIIPDLHENLLKACLHGAKNTPEALANLLRLTGQEAEFLRGARALVATMLEKKGGARNLRDAKDLREMDEKPPKTRLNRAHRPSRRLHLTVVSEHLPKSASSTMDPLVTKSEDALGPI